VLERKRFDGVSRYFGGLTTGQKAAAGLLVAVMVGTGVWVAGRSTRGAMEPMLDQAFTDADVASITERLKSKAIPSEVHDGKVFVASDKKFDALSDLYYNAVLTGGTESGFDTLFKQMSAFDPPSKTEKMFNRARETTMEGVIARFKGVRKATVLIDPTNERHISGSILPSAMVDVQTRGDANARQISTAAVNVLTGAVANLSRERVKVTIDGASFNVAAANNEEIATDDVLARKQQCEQMYVSKVRRLLSYIPEVVVSVSVDLDLQSKELEKRSVDPDNYVLEEIKNETTVSGATGEPAADGLVANAVPPERTENKKVEHSLVTGETIEKSRTPAGRETVKSASVAVPRSYFVGIYRHATHNDEDPDDALLQPVVDARAAKIRGLVKNALGLESDSDVTVEPYDDAAPAAVAATGAATSAAPVVGVVAAAPTQMPSTAAMINAHAHDIALVLFGGMTLVGISLILRRGAARPITVMSSEAAQRAALLNGALVEGPVGGMHGGGQGNGYGCGQEEAEAHRMFRRVRDVVADRPEDAARVLREWIYQEP
jgi:flagellar biosynthesis/type III secretory pathway M-ring protein FliF/YscJ